MRDICEERDREGGSQLLARRGRYICLITEISGKIHTLQQSVTNCYKEFVLSFDVILLCLYNHMYISMIKGLISAPVHPLKCVCSERFVRRGVVRKFGWSTHFLLTKLR